MSDITAVIIDGIQINLTLENAPPINVTIAENPVLSYVAIGEQGPEGAQGRFRHGLQRSHRRGTDECPDAPDGGSGGGGGQRGSGSGSGTEDDSGEAGRPEDGAGEVRDGDGHRLIN